MVKVLHIIPSLSTGGAESNLCLLATTRRTDGPPACVVCLSERIATSNEELLISSGIQIYYLNVRSSLDVPLALRSLARIINDERPDCLQGWLYYGDLFATLGLWQSGQRRSTRLYWGVRCSNLDFSRYSRRLRWTVVACAKLSPYPDAVIANSVIGRTVHLELGYKPRAFSVIPNGIDTDRFRPDRTARSRARSELGIPTDQPIVTIGARVDPQKDHDTFLQIVDLVPNATFVAAGSGTEQLPQRTNLIQLGTCTEMPTLLAASDLVLCTSAFGEGFPTILGEAMACGTPAVTTDVGDARAIVSSTGRIREPRDAVGLATSISELLAESENCRRRRSDRARTRILEHFSLVRMIRSFDTLYIKGEVSPIREVV